MGSHEAAGVSGIKLWLSVGAFTVFYAVCLVVILPIIGLALLVYRDKLMGRGYVHQLH